MAVNCREDQILECLLEAGAAASLYTGPLVAATIPVSLTHCTEVHEYDYDGHRYSPLHLASLMSSNFAVSALLKGGGGGGGGHCECRNKAEVDERVQSGFCDDVEDFMTPGSTRRCEQIVLSMSTALHLAQPESAVAATLAQAGANLLAQNFELELAGTRLNPAQLGQWVWSQAQGRETALLLQRKQVPAAVERRILQHVVELHLAEQFDNAVEAELQPVHAPLMAIALISDEHWEAECTTIAAHFAANHWYSRAEQFVWTPQGVVTQRREPEATQAFSQFVVWVRGLLEESKRAKMADFSAQISECTDI
jgi:hypothetical protein